MHARPAILVHGGTAEAPQGTVFLPTNDGVLHAFDMAHIEEPLVPMTDVAPKMMQERWAFIPKEFLTRQNSLFKDAPTANRRYALDGDAKVPNVLQQIRTLDLQLLAQRLRDILEAGVLTQLSKELRVLLAEVGFLHRLFAIAENPVLHQFTSPRHSCAAALLPRAPVTPPVRPRALSRRPSCRS